MLRTIILLFGRIALSETDRRTAGFILLGLVLGLALGAWAMRLYFDRTLLAWNPANRLLVKLDEDLHLSPDQREKMALILVEQKERMKDLRKDWERNVGTLGREGEDRIAALLTPEQSDRFMRAHDEIHGRMVRFLWAAESSPTALAIAPSSR